MKKKTTEEKKKVAVTNNTANTASEATTNKEAYENSKNKLTENLKKSSLGQFKRGNSPND